MQEKLSKFNEFPINDYTSEVVKNDSEFLIYGFSNSPNDEHIISNLAKLEKTRFTICYFIEDGQTKEQAISKYDSFVNKIASPKRIISFMDITDKNVREAILHKDYNKNQPNQKIITDDFSAEDSFDTDF